MKIKCTIAIQIILFLSLSLNAKIWRVDSNTGNYADFRSGSEAHTGADAGDTLYFAGSGNTYGSVTFTKQLYVFGPGYFLGYNPDMQVNTASARFDALTFNNGSQGTVICGVEITNGRLQVNTDNITIRRCRLHYSGSYNTVTLSTGVSNISILQCYITHSNYTSHVMHILENCSSVFIMNCYIAGASYYPSIHSYSSSAAIIQNCVIGGDMDIFNSQIRNCIYLAGNLSGYNNAITYSLANGTQFGEENNNLANIDMSTVFQGGSGDAYFKLSPSSPAIGAGFGGDDCGIYGGTDPYVLSGVPSLPSIYYMDAPFTGSSLGGYPVHLKVKSNN